MYQPVTTAYKLVNIFSKMTPVSVTISSFFSLLSAEHSFTLWDRWEVRGSKDFKLKDFLKSVQVSFNYCLCLTSNITIMLVLCELEC